MKKRTKQATQFTAKLSVDGYNVFSPLTHSDAVADHLPEDLRKSHDFWLSRDFQIIKLCDEMHVLCLDGWEESFGVQEEIKLATKLDLKIVYHSWEPIKEETHLTKPAPLQKEIETECNQISDLLIEKNKAYGNSALEPCNIFCKSPALEQISVRIDDKLNRLKMGSEYPGDDTVLDLIGYLILYRIAKEKIEGQEKSELKDE